MHFKSIKKRISENPATGEYLRVAFLILFFCALRFLWINSIIERDEGIFGLMGWQMSKGNFMAIIDNKPPLIYTIYAASNFLFGNSILPVRIFNNLLFLTSIIFLYLAVKRLFKNKNLAFFSSIAYGLIMNIPALEGQLAMSESFLSSFSVIAFYFLMKYLEKKNVYSLMFCGIFSSFAALTKYTGIAALVFPIVVIAIQKSRFKEKLKEFLILILPFALMWAFFIMLLIKKGLFRYFIYSILVINPLFYSSSSSHYIPLSNVLLILCETAPFLLLAAAGIFYNYSKNQKNVFFSWLLIFFAVSIIPPAFGHYFLQAAAPMSVLCACGALIILELRFKFRTAIILLIIAGICISLPVQIRQYPDFNIKWKNFEARYSDFSSYDEQIDTAKILKSSMSENETFLIWGWSGEIFWLTERIPPMRSAYFLCYERTDIPIEKMNSKMDAFGIPLSFKDELIRLEKNRSIFEEKLISYFPGKEVKNVLIFPQYSRACFPQDKDVFSENFPNCKNIPNSTIMVCSLKNAEKNI